MEAVASGSCKKCEVVDQWGEAVHTEDGCGGEVYNMEQRTKARAYEMGCDYTVRCESYKKEED